MFPKKIPKTFQKCSKEVPKSSKKVKKKYPKKFQNFSKYVLRYSQKIPQKFPKKFQKSSATVPNKCLKGHISLGLLFKGEIKRSLTQSVSDKVTYWAVRLPSGQLKKHPNLRRRSPLCQIDTLLSEVNFRNQNLAESNLPFQNR